MAVPDGQFRELDITAVEPSDRTTEGSVVDNVSNLSDLGEANNTSGASQLGPFCYIYRITNMQGNSTVDNIKFGITSDGELSSNVKVYIDITSEWTQNKSLNDVITGSPGLISEGIPSVANLTKIDGGAISGVNHADTSQYIYVVVEIPRSEEVGDSKSLYFGVKADYNV